MNIYQLRCLLILFFCSIGSAGIGQNIDFGHYTPLRCEGAVPADFLKPSYEKYYSDISDIKKNKTFSKKDKMLRRELSFITNYKIDDILMSGKVLYGNKVCDYITRIADKLLANEPTLRKKLRFYLLNVPDANALCTNNGIVFVTTGLMAQVENEAQLAFVLSHEISHFKLNHSFESFKKTKDIMKGRKYDDLGSDEKLLRILKYSKENEAEADAEGLEMFSAAGYDQNESVKMMDILLYSYLPFDDIPFPKTYFNDSFYKLPDGYIPDSAREITASEDEDDEESSHPNVEYRKLNLEKYIEDNSKGELYFFGRENFEEVVRLCRYEMGYILILKGNYTKAFYNAFLLQDIYGESQYTAELMVAALYGVSKNKLALEDEDSDSDDAPKDYEGQISRVFSLFNRMKKDEFNVLAARAIHSYYQKYPTRYTTAVRTDIFIDLLYSHKYMKGSFSKEYKPQDKTEPVADTVSATEETAVKKVKSSKISKIKKKKTSTEMVSGSRYFKNAFVSSYQAPAFAKFLDSIETAVEDLKKEEENYGMSELRKYPEQRYRQAIRDERAAQRKRGKRLGIDSIIMVAPSYSSIFYGYGDPKVNQLSDELKSIEITRYLENNAAAQKLNLELIDINRRESLTAEKMNDFSLVSNWLGEKYAHTDKNDLLFSQKYVDGMISEKGYSNVGFTGFSYENSRHEVSGGALFLSAIFWPTLPFTIYYALDHEKELDYYYIVYDLKTGKQKMIIVDTIHRRPKAKVINLKVAYSLFQTKTPSKAK